MLDPEPRRVAAGCGLAGSILYRPGEWGTVKHLLMLSHAPFLHIAFLFTFVFVLNREGIFVPSNNESLYLLLLAKLWDPNVLSNDWTFSGPLPTHLVFNFVFGPLTLLFPLEVVGWIGRIFSWALILLALTQLGKQFRLPSWMITASVLFWLLHGQSIVGGEWIIGSFEAKSISYALLLFSLSGFMGQRKTWPSILLGLSFSFHPIVGLWGVLAAGLSLVLLRCPFHAMVRFACYTGLFALPGFVPLFSVPFEGGADSIEAWRFLTLVVIPYHLDPFYFSSSVRLLLLAILLGFNWLSFRLNGQSDAWQFLMAFQAFLGMFFVLGFVLRFTENYELLKFMPCRVFPVLLPLLFLLQFMTVLHQHWSTNGAKGLALAGVLTFASIGSPLDSFFQRVQKSYSMWTRQEADWEQASKWIARNTPTHSLVISPPWRGEIFYLSQRAQVANWWVPRFDRLTEWRERLESVAGNLETVRPATPRARIEHMVRHYNQLSHEQITSIAQKYGANYLVSSAHYDFPVLFTAGSYTVYSLRNIVHPDRIGANRES